MVTKICGERGMGKSIASCFKIITCGSVSVDHDDLRTPQASRGRSGWSFRKRSASHRVLSNIVISEAPASVDKESPQPTAANFQVQLKTVEKKTSVVQWTEEKNKMTAQRDSNLSDIIATREDDCSADATLNVSTIILIQAAIRGYLARRVLLKQKNIIKLQAAIRGHLVRRHAAGTLRCVQAIVKMQALIRARQALLPVERCFQKPKENSAKDNLNPTVLRSKREAKPNSTYTYTSIEKLSSNKFAQQLMESTPRTKSINIKCDPSKSDSAWKWLERWMSVSSVSNEELKECGSAPEQKEKENIVDSGVKGNILCPSDIQSVPIDLNSTVGPSAESSDNDEDLITYDAENLDAHAFSSTPPSTWRCELQNIEESDSRYDVVESDALEMKETNLIKRMETTSVLSKDETGNEQDLPDLKKFSIAQPETEGTIFFLRASYPPFIAGQSKFEELSSAATLSSYYPGVEPSFEQVSSFTDPAFRTREMKSNDNSIYNALAVQFAGSECGTELSISSTLDSPDISEGVINDLEQRPKILDATDHPRSRENLGVKANENSSILRAEISYANKNQFERNESAHSSECVSSMIASVSLEKLGVDQSNMQVELGSKASHLVFKSSPEASPRSHITFLESQATPSSQVSLDRKKSRGEKSDSSHKQRSLSADKRFHPTVNHDSTAPSSLEQLQKEHKTGKMRNSFGSAKLDLADQGSKGSSSSISLPSYMQATESARAKAVPNGSPRSSPDVQNRDIFIKNRPSLSGTNGRQGSPHVHRSLSQAQQNAKGNGVHSSQDRRWQR